MKILFLSLCLLFAGGIHAQDSVSDKTEGGEDENEIEEDLYYFQQRLINLPTGVNLRPYDLEFKILHRFTANVSKAEESQIEDLFGLDLGAIMSFELAYGLYSWDNQYGLLSSASLGYHRSTNRRINEIFAQISIVDEFAPDEFGLTRKFWFGLSLKVGWAQGTTPDVDDNASWNIQVMANKRIFPWLHVYVNHGITTAAHYARVGVTGGRSIFNVGFGAYFNPFYWWDALSNIRLMGEYFLPYRRYTDHYDSWGAGFAIVTGSHTFSIIVTNTIGTTLDTNAQGPLENEVHLGFNITRRFAKVFVK